VNRKQRRALKKNKTKELSDKVASFGNLGDECLVCLKPFDKKNKSMVMTWSVVVRDSNDVRLYCPDCWDKATHIVTEYFKENKQ
jgi:hypothetical protein